MPPIHTLDGALSISKVERLAAILDRSDEFVLDLSSVRNVESGAGWRLGNLLRPWDRRFDVRVRNLIKMENSQDWFLSFTKTGLGLAIAEYARSVQDSRHDVTDRVRAYYSRSQWLSGGLVLVPNARLASLPIDNFDLFYKPFDDFLARVHRTARNYISVADRRGIAQLCFQSVQNVVDHAAKAPLAPSVSRVSFMSFAFHPRLDASVQHSGDFRDYQLRIPAVLEGRTILGFLEIVISDDGSGVAARQALDIDVYEGPRDIEVAALNEAMSAGGTVKLRVHDSARRGDPGFGYSYILDSLKSLSAYASLRTGRLLAVFDGSITEEKPQFELSHELLAYIAGTSVHVVIPVASPQQQRLPIT